MEDSREQDQSGRVKLNSQSFLSIALRVSFSRPVFVAIAVAIAAAFWIVFNLFDQLLFFQPTVSFYITPDAVASFIISSATAAFLGIVGSMNAFALTSLRAGRKLGAGSLLSGTSLATLSSACAGCSSLGLTLVSTLGGAGLAATTVMSVYQIPLRLISLGILVWAFYSTSRKILGACRV